MTESAATIHSAELLRLDCEIQGKRCEHPPKAVYTDWIAVQKYSIGDTWHIHAEALSCSKCGAMLGMEPSNDSPEAVKIEIRAAEIAARHVKSRGETKVSVTEFMGWHNGEAFGDIEKYSPGYDAGYLARCIVTHDERQGSGE